MDAELNEEINLANTAKRTDDASCNIVLFFHSCTYD